MEVRPATAADIRAVLAIWNPVIEGTPFTVNAVPKTHADIAAMLARTAAEGHAFLVAEDAGEVQGFAALAQFRAGVGYARSLEHTVMVAAGAHGRGVGQSLLACIQAEARGRGAHALYAGVSAENPGALRFHAAMGFATLAVLPEAGWKFGRFIDLHLLHKFLR